ncbi:hypothetical protein J4409_02105 [Candidatus Woesearchaeota archaeon]|nr:hypothetical protein [Candidatus Woesearchaeota archaeon]
MQWKVEMLSINKYSKGWEVSIIKLEDKMKERKYKVTRKWPEMKIAETKMFSTKTKEGQKGNFANG